MQASLSARISQSREGDLLHIVYSCTISNDLDDRVPTIVSDLVKGAMPDSPLASLVFGGSPVNKRLPEMARKVYPRAFLSGLLALVLSTC